MKQGQHPKGPTLWDTLKSPLQPAQDFLTKFRWEDLSASEAGVLQAVIDRLNPKTLTAQISIADLANAVGVTRDSAKCILRRLRRRGLIQAAQPPASAKTVANVWTVPAISPPPATGNAPQSTPAPAPAARRRRAARSAMPHSRRGPRRMVFPWNERDNRARGDEN
jgi:hypothetical protein